VIRFCLIEVDKIFVSAGEPDGDRPIDSLSIDGGNRQTIPDADQVAQVNQSVNRWNVPFLVNRRKSASAALR
jgi:hypothetical protein